MARFHELEKSEASGLWPSLSLSCKNDLDLDLPICAESRSGGSRSSSPECAELRLTISNESSPLCRSLISAESGENVIIKFDWNGSGNVATSWKSREGKH